VATVAKCWRQKPPNLAFTGSYTLSEYFPSSYCLICMFCAGNESAAESLPPVWNMEAPASAWLQAVAVSGTEFSAAVQSSWHSANVGNSQCSCDWRAKCPAGGDWGGKWRWSGNRLMLLICHLLISFTSDADTLTVVVLFQSAFMQCCSYCTTSK